MYGEKDTYRWKLFALFTFRVVGWVPGTRVPQRVPGTRCMKWWRFPVFQCVSQSAGGRVWGQRSESAVILRIVTVKYDTIKSGEEFCILYCTWYESVRGSVRSHLHSLSSVSAIIFFKEYVCPGESANVTTSFTRWCHYRPLQWLPQLGMWRWPSYRSIHSKSVIGNDQLRNDGYPARKTRMEILRSQNLCWRWCQQTIWRAALDWKWSVCTRSGRGPICFDRYGIVMMAAAQFDALFFCCTSSLLNGVYQMSTVKTKLSNESHIMST